MTIPVATSPVMSHPFHMVGGRARVGSTHPDPVRPWLQGHSSSESELIKIVISANLRNRKFPFSMGARQNTTRLILTGRVRLNPKIHRLNLWVRDSPDFIQGNLNSRNDGWSRYLERLGQNLCA